MNLKIVKFLLVSALFCSVIFAVIISTDLYPIPCGGDAIPGGHPYIGGDPVDGGHLCGGDPIGGGHPLCTV